MLKNICSALASDPRVHVRSLIASLAKEIRELPLFGLPCDGPHGLSSLRALSELTMLRFPPRRSQTLPCLLVLLADVPRWFADRRTVLSRVNLDPFWRYIAPTHEATLQPVMV